MSRYIVLSLLWLFSVGAGAGDASKFETLWRSLDQWFTPVQTECPEEYTWLPELGLRGFYCHLKPALTYAQLQALAGMPIFLDGPHDGQNLNLKSQYQFGHYNPEFVRWLHRQTVIKDNPTFQRATQALYERYVQRLARTFYAVYQHFQQHPDLLRSHLAEYQAFISSAEQAYFANDYYDLLSEYDAYEVNSAALFWLRRHIDGTAPLFFAALTDLLSVYDSALMRSPAPEASPILENKAGAAYPFHATVSVEDVAAAVMAVFPAAYTQFMRISFDFQDHGEIWPAEIRFYLPASKIAEGDDFHAQRAALVKRISNARQAVCEQLELGQAEQLDWLAWPDKTVRQVIITLNIGC